MALQYCQVCGVLIPNAPPGVDATICEKCFATRKLIIAGDEDSRPAAATRTPSSATTQAPERVQFQCPSCQSLLQLPPVKKRTKIKCPRCTVDFYMHPDGAIEAGTAAPQTPSGPQSKLIEDLKPLSDLNVILERVPEKKTSPALPSVLDSDRYRTFAEQSSQDEARKDAPAKTGTRSTPSRTPTSRWETADRELARERADESEPARKPLPLEPRRDSPRLEPRAASAADPGLELVAESSESTGVNFAPGAIEQLVPKADEKKPPGKIVTARRTRDAVNLARREREQRELRSTEAQRHTLALLERRHKRVAAIAKLVALVAIPLVVALVFLASTTAGTGFATKGALGARLADLGELVRRGVQGLEALATGK